jgi:DNA gyrase subunit B
MSENSDNYKAKNIKILKNPIEGIRSRPGLYFQGGASIDGFHQLLLGLIDNAIEECKLGFGNSVMVTIHKNESITVKDDGSGIPIDFISEQGESFIEILFTDFDYDFYTRDYFNSFPLRVSKRLFSIQASLILNALSEKLDVEISKGKDIHKIVFEKGLVKEPLSIVGSNTENHNGTKLTFKPDPDIFKNIERTWDYERIRQRLQDLSYLVAGTRITLTDKRAEQQKTEIFLEPNGMGACAQNLTNTANLLYEEPIVLNGESEGISMQIGLAHCGENKNIFITYTNLDNNRDGGKQVEGFRKAYTSVMNNHAKAKNLIGQDATELENPDWLQGLHVALSLQLDDPQYESNAKSMLLNPEAETAVNAIVTQKLTEFLEGNPHIGKIIVERAVKAAQARVALQTVKTPSDLSV